MRKTHVAFIYDFDGTLAHGNIQEYNFIPALNMTSDEFWNEVQELKVKNNMENVLAYMYLMLKKAEEHNMSVKKQAFVEYGKNIKFYPGVIEWFDRINAYAKDLGLVLHHYIVSSGIKEMIEGTEIKDKFEKIYACSFLYNIDEIAKWPAVSVNYTNKTQFLYRINKGIYEVYDESINNKMADNDKKIPFTNMIYFGDGMTDVPCMKLVKDNGGTAISLYEKNDTLASKLLVDGRVNHISKTDYTEGSDLDIYIKNVLLNIKKGRTMNSKLNNEITRLVQKYNLDSLAVTENPRELIIMLISEIKKCSKANIKLDMVKITDEDINILEEMLNKIANEKLPPQYVINKEYIYGNEFFVNNNVLIPRQDTETLIEIAINIVRCREYKTMLDLCTGSGVIGISVIKNTNLCEVTLSDVSLDALQVARKNVNLNGVEDRCNIVESNMFKNLYKLNNKYDIIASNPPYLTKAEMKEISEFVEKEPSMALYGGKDGLDYYRIIFNEAKNFLNTGGTIAVEIGYEQAKDVIGIISSHKEYTDIRVIPDINNKDRVVVCHFQNK